MPYRGLRAAGIETACEQLGELFPQPPPDNWGIDRSSFSNYSTLVHFREGTPLECIERRIGKNENNAVLDVAGGANGAAVAELIKMGIAGSGLFTNLTDKRNGENPLLDLPKIPASPDSPDERSSNFSALDVAMATSPPYKIACSPPLDKSEDSEVSRKSSLLGFVQGDLMVDQTWRNIKSWQQENAPNGFSLVVHRPYGGLQDLPQETYLRLTGYVLSLMKPGGILYAQIPSDYPADPSPNIDPSMFKRFKDLSGVEKIELSVKERTRSNYQFCLIYKKF